MKDITSERIGMLTIGDSAQNSFRKGFEFRSNTPGSYRIRVVGELDVSGLEHLRGLEISTSGPGKKPITTLTGVLPDQAALFKILHLLYDMRLPILSIVRLEST